MKAIPFKIPAMPTNKRLQRVQRQRREQLKSVVSDVSRLAIKEIERLNEFANEILTEEADNPIILEEGQEKKDHEDEISI